MNDEIEVNVEIYIKKSLLGDSITFIYDSEEIERTNKLKSKKWKPKRGEPIFVWDNSSDPDIPCPVYYFRLMEDDAIRCYSNTLKGGCGTLWHHMRKFDPALVGIPRKYWPKAENGEEV